jgi:hypothetical protein
MKDIHDFMHEVYQFYAGHMYMTPSTYVSNDSAYNTDIKVCIEFRDTTFDVSFTYFIPYTLKNRGTVEKKAIRYLRDINNHLDNMKRGI